MARREKIIRIASDIAAMAVGALFIYAGEVKAVAPAQFADDIANYRLLPHAAAVALALYLPWLEMICGLALVFKKAFRGALCILASLCLVFLAALASAKARGLDISCGCFGHAHPQPLGHELLLDLALLAALLLILAFEFRARPSNA